MTAIAESSVKQRAGDAVVAALKAEGVEFVFGLVGSHVVELYDALVDAPEIRHITVKHETTASGMADAYGRITGKPGVCLVTAGPGATNSLTGVAQAYMAASPLIHISGAVPRGASYESFHGVDRDAFLLPMFEEVTKWSVAIERAEDIPAVFAEAFRIATSDRPGPVHIEIPQNVLSGDATEIPVYRPATRDDTSLERSELDEIVSRIRESEKPVIWAGKGVKATFAHDELAELAELLEAPVILGGDASGSLPDIHPLSTGQHSLYQLSPMQRDIASEADLIFVVGERGGTGHADRIFESTGAPVGGIWLGNEGELPDSRSAFGAVAHVKTALNQLIEAAGDQQRERSEELRTRLSDGKEELRKAVMSWVHAEYGQRRPMHYGVALETLRDFVDDDTIVMGDIGEHNQWSRLLVETRNRTTFVPEGYWGAMGFGLPGAMAAKLAEPEKRVACVTGDGCFLMASADFSTAVECGINPVVIILNDRQYGMIVGMQRSAYGRVSNTGLDGPDFVAFSRSFGGDGMRVDEPEQMREALERGFKSDVIFVIDARCDFDFPSYNFDRALEMYREDSHS
ncbi:MAG: thiamine pyrophosphate-binding protein [Thermomicrobiales bacterium]